jgi:hypothetical protein
MRYNVVMDATGAALRGLVLSYEKMLHISMGVV